MARAAFCLFCVLAVLTPACDKPQEYRKPVRPVTVALVSPHPGNRSVTYSLNLVPYSQTLLSFKVSGRVESIAQVKGVDGLRNIQAGDRVKKGQVLARIDPADYKENLHAANARLAAARAVLKNAGQNFTRAKSLYKSQSLTKQDYQGALARYETAKDQENEALAGANQARTTLDETALKAPSGGVILGAFLQKGSLVSPAVQAFVVADIESIKAVFGVPSSMLGHVTLGQTMDITLTALAGEKFTGKITAISPSADQRTRVFEVEITLPNKDDRLKPGMVGSLKLQIGSGDPGVPMAAVPLSALVRPPGKPKAYAVYVAQKKDGKTYARLQEVTPGNVLGNSIEILKGLSFGEQVIIKGANFVKNNEQVSIIPSP